MTTENNEGGNTALTSGGDAPAPAGNEAATPPNAADAMYPNGEVPKADDAAKPDGEKPSEEKPVDPPKEGEKPAEDKGKEGEPVKAEDYDLTAPEGFDLNPEVEKEFRDFAASKGWSKDDVNNLKAMQVKLYERQSEAHADMVTKWGEEAKASKEIGGAAYDANIGVARNALREFFPEAARNMLDTTGLGNHPDIITGFVRIGKAMGEGKTLTGGKDPGSTSIVDALYPSS